MPWGELATISASGGIIVQYLAESAKLQARLHSEPELPPAVDEIVRVHAPLIANRRVTTEPVEIGGRRIEAGERLTLIWAFDDPDAFRLDRDPGQNLLYGAGIHVCPERRSRVSNSGSSSESSSRRRVNSGRLQASPRPRRLSRELEFCGPEKG